MNAKHFDDLSRSLIAGQSRRALVRELASSGLMARWLTRDADDVVGKHKTHHKKKNPPAPSPRPASIPR
jgi:hypothetical protein